MYTRAYHVPRSFRTRVARSGIRVIAGQCVCNGIPGSAFGHSGMTALTETLALRMSTHVQLNFFSVIPDARSAIRNPGDRRAVRLQLDSGFGLRPPRNDSVHV